MDPKPLWLLAELTYKCPLQCPYCSNPLDFAGPRFKRELSTEEWCRVFREAKALGVLQLGLSGGEPTLRQDLEELVREAHRLGLYTSLITSAYRLTKERLAALKAAGLDHVQISIQGADAELSDAVAGTASYRDKIAAYHYTRELGFPLTVNVVLHRRNLHQVEALIRLAESLGAERIELANTQFYGWALHNRDALMPPKAQLDEAWQVVQRERARLGTRLEIVWVLPDYHEQYPKPCMGGWARAYMTVTPAGEVWPCHAAGRITTLQFANVRDHPLEWIWNESDAFTRFRGDAWMPEPCRSCPRKTVDFGGCRCQAFLIAGDAVGRDALAVRRRIGLVFQETTLDRDLTVEENLRFAARLWDLPRRVAEPRIDRLLSQFGLDGRRREPVRALSGGLRRALDIARGILHEPRVLFLDEPTAGLDPRARRSLWQLIRALRESTGLTVFLTTHYVEEAEPCDRVAILDGGRLAALGAPADLKREAGVGSLEEVFLARTGHPFADGGAA